MLFYRRIVENAYQIERYEKVLKMLIEGRRQIGLAVDRAGV